MARLQESFPTLFIQPVERIYQLAYLDEKYLEQFATAFFAGKLTSLWLVNKLVYGQDDLGEVVLSELVAVYLVKRVATPLLLLLPRQGVPYVLPVSGRLSLGIQLLLDKRLIQ